MRIVFMVVLSLLAFLAPVACSAQSCSAVRLATNAKGTLLYGAAWNRGTEQEAVELARQQVRQRIAETGGENSNDTGWSTADPQFDYNFLTKGCGHSHGAVAVAFAEIGDDNRVLDSWRTVVAKFDDDKAQAMQEALDACNAYAAHNHQAACTIDLSW